MNVQMVSRTRQGFGMTDGLDANEIPMAHSAEFHDISSGRQALIICICDNRTISWESWKGSGLGISH